MNKVQQRRRTVLCVDPRQVIRSHLQSAMSSEEAFIISASDGSAAIRAIEAVSPDAVITDLETPDYSGADLALALKNYGPFKVPVLLVVPDDCEDGQEICTSCEAEAFVRGDPPAESLAAMTRLMLEMAAQRHKLAVTADRLRRTQRRISNDDKGLKPADDGFLPITGFRRVLLNEAKRAGRYKIPLGLIMVSYDSYPTLKARYGEAALGPLFNEMSRIIIQAIRDIDIPVRISQDRVLLMLPHTESKGSMRVASRIASMARRLRIDIAGERVRPTVSVGLASYEGHNQISFADLSRRAQQALDKVRERGGDGVAQG